MVIIVGERGRKAKARRYFAKCGQGGREVTPVVRLVGGYQLIS
jgi:hypothetical protein